MSERLILIDGHSLIHRGYHAVQPLSDSQGRPTNAVFGFLQMILPLLQEEKPERIAIAFDPPGPTFRNEIDDQYKANRQEPPDDLVSQFGLVREVVEALGICGVEMPGYEADDVIGTLATRYAAEGTEVLIVSGDRDMLQLVGPNIKVLVTLRGLKETKLFDEAAVVEHYGIRPEQFADLKAISGDSSDNIPGVPGIGDKGAVNLLLDYGSLDEIYAHIDDVPREAMRRKLVEHEALARQSKELARIVRDVPLEISDDEVRWSGPQAARIRRLLAELEFVSLLERTADWGVSFEGTVQRADETAVAEICRRARECGHLVVVPVEGAPDTITALALAVDCEQALVVEYAAEGGSDMGGLFAEETSPALPECLVELLADATVPKWGSRLKDAARFVCGLGSELRGMAFDAEVADYVLRPHKPHHSILHRAAVELGWWIPDKGVREGDGVDGEQLRSGAEALAVERFYKKLLEELEADGLLSYYEDVEMPVAVVLAGMETRGIAVDGDRLAALGHELQKRIQGLQDEIYALAGETFNIDSPKQVGEVLFGTLGLAKGRKTKTGWSTSAEVLEELAQEHEIAARILEYRELAKLVSTYVEGLRKEINKSTGRIHTTFEQTVTTTGRLSSRNPNLQNIPIKTETGREIRACFVASPGNVLVSADYSQIELRLLAHLSEDPTLLAAFADGADVHQRTAALIFDCAEGDVDSTRRRVAKTVNYAVIYGMGATALSKQLGIDRKQAVEFIEQYFARFSAVQVFMHETIEKARTDGFVTTLLGRRREIPELRSPLRQMQAYGERAAGNTPLQGSAADIVKVSMVRLANMLRQSIPSACILLQVHDELVVEVPKEEVFATGKAMREVMENVVALKVPLTVDVEAGDNWRDLQPLAQAP